MLATCSYVAGPVVRIAPNEFSISDPKAIDTIYGHGKKFRKSDWYTAFAVPGSQNVFAETDITLHAQARRGVANMYALSVLVHYEPAARECVALITQRFHELADKGTVINLHYWLQMYAFDVIAQITVGKRFGFLDVGNDHLGIFKTLHAVQSYSSHAGIFPEVHRPFFKLQSFLARLGFQGNGLAAMTEFAEKQVTDRLARWDYTDNKQPDQDDEFLTKVLWKHKENPEVFTMEDVHMTCGQNLVAGSDTTSIALSSTMWYLSKYPEKMAKLREEISQARQDSGVSGMMRFKDSQKLSYLQACIKEAMRLHPPAGTSYPRVVPPGGVTILGHYFPEGTIVGINSWVTAYDHSVFGPDERAFRPERWLDSDPEHLKRMERAWIPFGYGARTCLGKNISILELSIIIPEIVRTFDFELARNDENLESSNNFLVKPTNVYCRIKSRTS
ncbi:hypothetical protein FOVSG1_006629 [Fusarium oxysporum f. sp. vasinfectum]